MQETYSGQSRAMGMRRRMLSHIVAGLVPGSRRIIIGRDLQGQQDPQGRTPSLRRRGEPPRPAEVDAALAIHLPFGQPACPKLLPGREYILCYTPVHPWPCGRPTSCVGSMSWTRSAVMPSAPIRASPTMKTLTAPTTPAPATLAARRT